MNYFFEFMNQFACHANTEKVSSKMNEKKFYVCIFEILINIIFTLQFKCLSKYIGG